MGHGYENDNAVAFETPEEMLAFLRDGPDLYSPSKELYVFGYNDLGSICAYTISKSEAKELSQLGDHWSAHLGWGGEIYDTAEYLREERGMEDPEDDALEFCRDTYKIPDWRIAESADD